MTNTKTTKTPEQVEAEMHAMLHDPTVDREYKQAIAAFLLAHWEFIRATRHAHHNDDWMNDINIDPRDGTDIQG